MSLLTILEAELKDRYHIERELGAGGMALVWVATDLRHQREVALKVLRPELALSGVADRFLREARVLADLQHPHILPLLDSGAVHLTAEGSPCPYFVMPLVRGESLRERLKREGPFSIDDVTTIATQVAGALDYAHKHGVIHRDVKPENLLCADDQVYLADFGIASAMQAGGDRLTETGLTIGTPAYMSPEQAAAERVLDGRSDQYSLACVVFEMLAGEPPFTGPTAQIIMAKRLAGPAPSVATLRSVPAQWPAALARALSRAPADRYPDTGSFAAALRDAQPAPSSSSAKGRRGIRWVALAAGILLLLLGARQLQRVPFSSHRPATVAHDSTAVELVRRADRAYAQRRQEGLVNAVQLYSQAIARDSAYAPAWNGLAQAYIRAYIWAFAIPGIPRDSLLIRALRATDGAFVADSFVATTWVTRSVVMRQLAPTDRSDALRAVHRALGLDPSAEAWNEYAFSLTESDSLAEALVARRRAVELRPSYNEAVQFLSLGHLWAGNYDSATVWGDSAIALNPTNITSRHAAGWAALARGDAARAEREFATAAQFGRGTEHVNAVAGLVMARTAAGDPKGARQLLLGIDSMARKEPGFTLHSVVFLAEAWGNLGEKDSAFAWLSRFEEPRDLHFQLHLRHDPAMEPLRADPRFRALLSASVPVR